MNVAGRDRFAAGRALRKATPRTAHAGWEPPAERTDPVALIEATDRGRVAALVPLRHYRMAQSAFAFYRGSAAIMAADLAGTPVTGLRVQACGDAHLSNFGAYASPERLLVFDVNDFDETLPGAWEWDLKRLVTSFVLAARHNRYPKRTCEAAARTAARAYRVAMRALAGLTALDVWYSRIDAAAIESAVGATAERHKIEDEAAAALRGAVDHVAFKITQSVDGAPRFLERPPLLYHPPPGATSALATERVIERYRDTLRDDIRTLFDRYRVVDTAYKVVGVGSVGTVCAVALLEAGAGDELVLQVKEASASVLEPYLGSSTCATHGERVVTGQRRMQAAPDIFLGWTRDDDGRDFYVRQLHDMKIALAVEGMPPAELLAYASLCGRTLARAHARTGDPAAIGGYLGTADTFDRALVAFAHAYAGQVERDFAAFCEAISAGRLSAAG